MSAMFFAELGATVHKIENAKTGGDMTRRWRLPEGDDGGISAYYASVNYGKQVHMLDLTVPADRDRLYALVAEADIVISNYNDEVSAKLGVTYSQLKAIKDDLIYAQLYAYEPGNNRPGFDLVMQAETGFMMMNGHDDGPPAKMPVALIDVLAAHQIKASILLALYQRARTGLGSYCTTSLYQSGIAALANQGSNYLNAGHIPGRLGTLHPNIAPYGDMFKTRDGEVLMLAVGSDRQWQKLGKTLNFTPTISDTFDSNEERVKNRQRLSDLLQAIIQELDYDNLAAQLTSNAIPFCKLMPLDEVFNNPLARQMILREKQFSGEITSTISTIAFDVQ
jgi:crotonobetainyl-CoA:carnitine CoA-transferase CaiB-like acyl-CoA transferase